MPTFAHSGNLGDIIYALPTIRTLGPGHLSLIMGGIPAAIRKYNNGPVFPEYENRLSEADYNMIAPLLAEQPYITEVKRYSGEKIDYDLDLFRGTVGQAFKTNFIETYAQTFKLPYNPKTDHGPWLYATPKRIARIAVTRTMRYHSNKTSTIPSWLELIRNNNLETDGVFLGLPDEHQAFCDLFNVQIPYYKCKDFLDMAEVIAGSDAFFGNQTFAYGVAQGLGKPTILETLTYRPLTENECFFPRDDCYYF